MTTLIACWPGVARAQEAPTGQATSDTAQTDTTVTVTGQKKAVTKKIYC